MYFTWCERPQAAEGISQELPPQGRLDEEEGWVTLGTCPWILLTRAFGDICQIPSGKSYCIWLSERPSREAVPVTPLNWVPSTQYPTPSTQYPVPNTREDKKLPAKQGWAGRTPKACSQRSINLVSAAGLCGVSSSKRKCPFSDQGLHASVVTEMCDLGQRGASYPKLRMEKKRNEQAMGKCVLK